MVLKLNIYNLVKLDGYIRYVTMIYDLFFIFIILILF